ncbi:MAG: hypothetical protein J7M18_00900 [Candidatus Eremiobacteraeota bacterium]|nr:hypothetical protein [Candidatus Eremiobacteraeota bacterium]
MDIQKSSITPSFKPVREFIHKVGEELKPKDALPLSEDKFTTRGERITKNIQRQFLNYGVPTIKTGTAAWVGMATGTAIACAMLATPIVGAALAGGFAIGAVIADQLHVPEKVGRVIKKGIGHAVYTVKDAAGHIGRTFKNVFSAVKNEKLQAGKTETKTAGTIKWKPALPGKAVTEKAKAKTGKKAMRKESRSTAGKILDTIGKGFGVIGKGMKAIPRFLYPSIQNANPAEKDLIIKTLDGMPLRTVTSTYKIAINPDLVKNYGAAGLARHTPIANMIELNKNSMAIPQWNKGVIIHELGHTRDFSEGLTPLTNPSTRAPWGKPPYVFDKWIDTPGQPTYAATNHWEDFAQSHKFYHMHPEKLKEVSPEKYAAMEKLHEPNLYDKVMDHKPIRDAGKKISEAIDKVPHLRTALEWMGAVAGPLTLRSGALKYKKGVIDDDEKKKFDGKMDMAKGTAYSMRVTAPAGLVLSLAHFIMGRKIKKGKLKAEKASRIANAVLACATGPVGMTAYAAMQELSKPEPGKVKKVKGEKLTKSDKAFMAKVGGGAIVGGAAGTYAGFKAGVITGATLGGLVGGPIGAGVGAVVLGTVGMLSGSYGGAKLGARLGRTIHDKKLS